MRTVRTVALTLTLLLSACGQDTAPAPEIPSWAKVAPEQIAEARKHGVAVAFENELGMKFVLIPAGTFLMGSPEDEEGRDSGEHQHAVTISKPFYMSIYEVTNGQYRTEGQYQLDRERAIADDSDWESRPAIHVTWGWAMSHASWFTQLCAHRTYTLPSEAQWEYACRAGATTAYSMGEALTHLQARFDATSSAPVGSYPPNAWGLYDMHGNAAEWCLDLCIPYKRYFIGEGWKVPTGLVDPVVIQSARYRCRVLRGGDFGSPQDWARSAARVACSTFLRGTSHGFRLVSPLPEPGER